MTERPCRFTRAHPCPICGGHDGLARGRGARCFGYLDASGDYARCTREDRAGGLRQNRDATFSHKLNGSCPCGQTHGEAAQTAIAGRRASPPRRATPQSFRSIFTLIAALRGLYGKGAAVISWTYHDAEGREAFRILRVNYLDDAGTPSKTYRPCHQAADGRWRLSKPGGLLPLYTLPGVLATPPGGIIVVLEGEKCADIAHGLGFANATTSAHGARSPWLSDWSPLAGRRVAIMSDADDDGGKYAAGIAGLVAGLSPPPTLVTVRLPGLSDGDDIEQWAAGRRAAARSDAEVHAELLSLIAEAFA